MGEALAGLRLRTDVALAEMERSLRQDGQLTPVLCVKLSGKAEIADGFKRLSGARTLGWKRLKAEVVETDAAGAKLVMCPGPRSDAAAREAGSSLGLPAASVSPLSRASGARSARDKCSRIGARPPGGGCHGGELPGPSGGTRIRASPGSGPATWTDGEPGTPE